MQRIFLISLLAVFAVLPLAATPADDLVAAVEKGDLDRVKAMIAGGVSIESVTTKYGYTPLMMSVIDCKIHITRWLLEKGANPNNTGRNRWSTLTWCAYRMNQSWAPYLIPIMKMLLDRGADPNLGEDKNASALLFAASNGQLEAVKLLLAKGADRNLKNFKGFSIAAVARQNGHEDIALLLEGKDPSTYMASLQYAVKKNDVDRVRTLLAGQVNVNETEATSRRTALYYAAMLGHLEIARLLLAADADADIQDRTGHTALMQAVNYGFPAVAMLLIRKGANLKLRTINDGAALCWQSNASVLEFALVRRMTEVVKAALAAGVPADGVDSFWVPLAYLTLSSNTDVDVEHARLLLAAGARPKPEIISKLRKYASGNPATARILALVQAVAPPTD